MAVLREMLGEREKPGIAHDRQVGGLRITAQSLASGFEHIGIGQARVVNWINEGEVLPRLKDIVGLAVFDEDLRFVRINERLAEINGSSVADHLGRSLREVLPELAEKEHRKRSECDDPRGGLGPCVLSKAARRAGEYKT